MFECSCVYLFIYFCSDNIVFVPHLSFFFWFLKKAVLCECGIYCVSVSIWPYFIKSTHVKMEQVNVIKRTF